MTHAELQAEFAKHPTVGRYTRTQLEEFQLGGVRSDEGDVTVIASHNYKCQDAYGPNQTVDLLGVKLSVYVGRRDPVVGIALFADDIPAIIAALAEQGRKLCEHDLSKWVANVGNCLNAYECSKCGTQFTVDSSD